MVLIPNTQVLAFFWVGSSNVYEREAVNFDDVGSQSTWPSTYSGVVLILKHEAVTFEDVSGSLTPRAKRMIRSNSRASLEICISLSKLYCALGDDSFVNFHMTIVASENAFLQFFLEGLPSF